MPNPGLAAGSFFLGGQLQGQQQQQLMMQQLQERMMDAQMKRAALLAQFQQLQQRQDALSKMPPDIQQKILLGEPMSDIDKYQQQQSKVPAVAQMIDNNPNLSADQKQSYKQILTAGNADMLAKLMSEKAAQPTPFGEWVKAHPELAGSPALSDLWEQELHKYDKGSTTNITNLMPMDPSKAVMGPGGKMGVLYTDKTGRSVWSPLPEGVTPPPKASETGDEGTLREIMSTHHMSREQALAYLEKIKTKTPAYKPPETAEGYGVQMVRNHDTGLYTATTPKTAPGVTGKYLGFGVADMKQRRDAVVRQTIATRRPDQWTVSKDRKRFWAQSDDGEWHELTKDGSWSK